MQQLHLDGISQIFGQIIRLACNGIYGGERGHSMLKCTRYGCIACRIACEVEVWRGVGMHGERCHDILLRRQQASDIAIDLADLVVGTGRRDSITICGSRRTTDKMISLVCRKDKCSIAFVDAILRQTSEKFPKRIVIRFQSRNVSS